MNGSGVSSPPWRVMTDQPPGETAMSGMTATPVTAEAVAQFVGQVVQDLVQQLTGDGAKSERVLDELGKKFFDHENHEHDLAVRAMFVIFSEKLSPRTEY
jgi:hypothetical protein